MVQFYNPAPAQHKCLFNDVLEFPHISRVLILHQSRHNLFRHPFYIFALKLVELGNDMIDKKRDILSTLAQAGQL